MFELGSLRINKTSRSKGSWKPLSKCLLSVSDCFYVCLNERQEVHAPAIVLTISATNCNKKRRLSIRPQCLKTQHVDQPTTASIQKVISHMLRIHLRRLFKSEKGVNRFRNMSEREGGAGEEINKSESQSFTLVSTLASVNAWVYYLPRSLSLSPPKQETSQTALPGGADSSSESLGCCWRSIKTRMWSICHHTKTCNDKNALPREERIFVSANRLYHLPQILTNEAVFQQFYNY